MLINVERLSSIVPSAVGAFQLPSANEVYPFWYVLIMSFKPEALADLLPTSF